MRLRQKDTLLPPLPDGVFDYWAIVHVILAETLAFEGSDEAAAIGYYRLCGLRSTPNRLKHVLAIGVEDGLIDWPETEVEKVDPAILDGAIRKRIVPVVSEGVWYLSGRNYYPIGDELVQ